MANQLYHGKKSFNVKSCRPAHLTTATSVNGLSNMNSIIVRHWSECIATELFLCTFGNIYMVEQKAAGDHHFVVKEKNLFANNF